MFKIKLLILLLVNIIFVNSCTSHRLNSETKYSVGHIGGEYAGFIFKNLLLTHLRGSDLYNQNSNYKIKGNIGHSSGVYITNIDNTSDRSNIQTDISIEIYDQKNECIVYQWWDVTEQFYIFAPSEKFISNQTASRQIGYNNTEQLIKNFINKVQLLDNLKCKNE